jgi:RNA-binding protein YlmH
MNNTPEKPNKAFRVTLELTNPERRLDSVLLNALRKQNLHLELRNLSRASLKELFKKKKIRIKGQIALPSSSLAKGTTYVDVLGYEDKDPA